MNRKCSAVAEKRRYIGRSYIDVLREAAVTRKKKPFEADRFPATPKTDRLQNEQDDDDDLEDEE